MHQVRYGGNTVIGKRAPLERLPLGPAKKAPTLARVGPPPPKKLLTPAALAGVPIGKRARDHDPESTRQRRLGGAIGVTTGTGAVLGTAGATELVAAHRQLRKPGAGPWLGSALKRPGMRREQADLIRGVAAGKATVVPHRALGRLGAGAALVGVGATLARRSHTRKWN